MTDPAGHAHGTGSGAVGGPAPVPGYPPSAEPEGPPAWWDIADWLWLAAQRARLDDEHPGGAPKDGPRPGDAGDGADRPPAVGPEPESDRDHRPAAPPPSPPPAPPPTPGEAPPPADVAERQADRPSWPTPDPVVAASPLTGVPVPGSAGARRIADRQRLPREFRPFRAWRSDPRRRELDERRTADDFAQRALAMPHALARGATPVLPRMRPGRELGVDLTLLVDDSLSMLLHRSLVDDFTELLAPLGVFRSMTVLRFDSDKASHDFLELVAAHGAAPAPEELFRDARDDAVALVLTDAVGHGWHTDAVQSWLARWGRSASLAVVQLLSRHQWRRTGMRLHRVELTTPDAPPLGLAANRRYAARPLSRGGPVRPAGGDGEPLPVPVLQLEPDSLRRWVRFVTREQAAPRYRVPALMVRGEPPEADVYGLEAPADRDPRPPEEPGAAVRRFRATASPAAFQLAVHLAAVPLNLPLIHFVQDTMLPGSDSTDLTEVLCGGLVERVPAEVDISDPARVTLRFRPGVRASLLASGGRRSEIIRLLRTVAHRLSAQVPWFADLERFMAAPDGAALADPDPDAVPFAGSVRAALDALPEPYRAAADRLAGLDAERPDIPPHSGGTTEASAVFPGQDGESPASTAVPEVEFEADPRLGGAPPTGEDAALPTPRDTTDGERVTTPDSLVDSTAPEQAPHVAPAERSTPTELPDGGTVVTDPSLPTFVRRRPGDPPPIWGQVPPRNPNFVGRAELLRQLDDRLSRGTTAVLPHSLQGMGGVGKTQLALEYVYRSRHKYELVWWVPADTTAQIQQSLIDLAVRLGLDIGGGEAAVAVRAALEALRSGRPYANWLLVYDNAGEPTDLRNFLPVDGSGRVLVTSRESAWRTGPDSALEVNVFDRAESIELLRRRGPATLTEEEADQIAEKLGDLPLAIEQTAVWLYETLMPVSEWLGVFEQKAADLLSSVRPSADYPHSVAATMNMSLDRLRDTNPAALQLLRVCAFLAPKPIPRRLFYGARNIEAPQELAEVLSDPIKLGRALRAIDKYALVRMDHRTESFQLHRLVQQTLKLPLSTEEQLDLEHSAHMLLANQDPGDPTAAQEWPRYAELLPHVRAANVVNCYDDWSRQLVLNEITFLAHWGSYQEALELAEHAVRYWREHLGPDHSQTLRAMLAYAHVLRQLGRFQDAYDQCSDALDILTATRGPDDEETLDARSKFTWDLRNIGELQRALEVGREVYEKYQRLFGPDDLLTVGAAHLHAVGLRHTGYFLRALEIDSDVYRQRSEMLGAEHPFTLGSRHARAIDLMEAGRYRDAMAEMEEIDQLIARTAAENSPGRLAALRTLSTLRRRNGMPQEALRLSESAWRMSLERNGPDAHDTVCSAACHALSLRAVDDMDAAVKLAEEVGQSYLSIFGPDHSHTASASVNLAVALRMTGRSAEALTMDEAAYEVLVDRLGHDHPSTIACAVNLASDRFAVGQVDAALELDTATVERCRSIFRPQHPLTLAARRNLVLDRRARGESGTEDEQAEVVRGYVEVFGPEHPATIGAQRGSRANCDIFLTAL
ncbi:FxSxx-COOH system tetratricopeptide repeat protein [Marinactinospora rubrisoli]|uniref:FxSxx-COOH system tetratricopeptide repeat protein n=1 Tax=Marinactinospora rubrisoli TaxID=2715399 RepID=A0ABW2KLF2_9ACTN